MRLRVSATGSTFDWETGQRQYRLGRGDGCALRFEGDAGKGVSWEHAAIEQQADGRATVTDLQSSNGTYVDGSRIEAAAPIRVGTLIQLGRAGPRIEVLELVAAPARPVPIASNAPLAPVLAAQMQPAAASNPSTDARPEPRRSSSETRRQSAGGLTFGIATAVLLAAFGTVAGYLASGRLHSADSAAAEKTSTPDEVRRPAPSKAAEQQAKVDGADGRQTSAGRSADSPSAAQASSSGGTPPPASGPVPAAAEGRAPEAADRWQKILEQLRPGIELVVVEDPKTHAAWPFATVAAVGPKEALTTASIGTELAKFKARGWKVSVRRDGQQPGPEVTDIRIHAAYEQAKPEEQLYFDVALLFTEAVAAEERAPSVPAAAALEVGQRVACITVDHEGEPIDRFQQLEPRAYAGKVFAITSLPPQPGGPRLLHLRGSFSDKARGSPIVNDRGELVALYCEPAPTAADGQKDLHIHYAKAIEAELIALAGDSSNKIWVRPATTNANPEKPSP